MRTIIILATLILYFFTGSSNAQSFKISPTTNAQFSQNIVSKAPNRSNAKYIPDNNPVTWDEEPTNYPTHRPTTYHNVDHIEVQAPTHYNSVPPGACALCRDGTYSFSKNRRGTCSRHGGVSKWLKQI